MSSRAKNNYKKLAGFFFEIGTLRKTPRTHMQVFFSSDLSDNIASHSFRVATIGWFLAHKEHADPYKVDTMCLFHDVSETRSGDQNWIHKRYMQVYDNEIMKDQLTPLPLGDELLNLHKEYHERESKEAIVTKDADLLDQILLIKEYIWQGNKEAEGWLRKGKGKNPNTHTTMLKTKTAKKLADKIISQEPGDWWKDIWTEQRRHDK